MEARKGPEVRWFPLPVRIDRSRPWMSLAHLLAEASAGLIIAYVLYSHVATLGS
jgi:hypothetical protein